MRVGIIVPQGWTGEYDGWDPSRAWARTVAVAHEADALGFDSIWLFDHFQTVPVPTDEITFEAFVGLAALAVETARVRLGHLVLCAGYRNPALVAKMIATLDVVSGGRAELGLGAGWKEDEFTAYGWGYPPLRTRMEGLEDALEIATRMLGGGRATYAGPAYAVHAAINVPRGLQRPRIPILVGGNGPNRTWRLAARFADELNLDWLSPEEVAAAMPVIASRCEEIGRDPATLRVSVNIGRDDSAVQGAPRVDLLRRYREAGVDRVMTLIAASADDDGALARFAEDCAAAGAELDGADAASAGRAGPST
jgi:F420-dependent oxidoreductase-like protein